MGIDNCGMNIIYSVVFFYGVVDFGVISGVEFGNYIVVYIGIDECGNVSICSVQFMVVDDVVLVVVCDDSVIVFIFLIGYGMLMSIIFDEGSFDNCSIVFIKVKRNIEVVCDLVNGDDSSQVGYQEWFDDEVVFCCEDIFVSFIMVIFCVYEVDLGDGFVNFV